MNKKFSILIRIFLILLVTTIVNCVMNAQTWQYLGPQYSVNVTSGFAVGYTGGTRTLYLAAKQDAVMESSGSTISWIKKPFSYPDFVVCESNNPSTVYSGLTSSTSGGVWKSTDGGNNWISKNVGLTNLETTTLTISPTDNNYLYLGAQYIIPLGEAVTMNTPPSLFASMDGGESWNRVSNFPVGDILISDIIFDPNNTSIRYVSSRRALRGVRRSDNSGGSWLSKISGMDNINITALAITPQNTSILYAGTDGNPSRIYKTTDKGDNWVVTSANSGIINDLKVDTFSPSTIYAATSLGVLKSINSGISWSLVNTGLADLDIRTIAIDPNTANLIYIGTTSKFYYSTNAGSTWIDAGADIVTSGGVAVYNDDVYSIAGTKTKILASKLVSGSTSWQITATQNINNDRTYYFLAKDLAMDPTNPNKLYAAGKYVLATTGNEYYGPKVISSVDGGTSWSLKYGHAWLSDPNASANDIEIDPNLSSKLFIATHYGNSTTWPPQTYSTNSGDTWISPFRYSGENNFSIRFDKSSGTTGTPSLKVYSGGGTGNLDLLPNFNYSIDGGLYFNSVNPPVNLPTQLIISGLAIDPNNPSTIYAGLRGEAKGTMGCGLYKSTDCGFSWQATSLV
ncbi:MAG: hypothetical protein HY964_04115 [Ignavibacteriales bacterium]|nr:hypothetical protein [Ignavibacteriales bacterium]